MEEREEVASDESRVASMGRETSETGLGRTSPPPPGRVSAGMFRVTGEAFISAGIIRVKGRVPLAKNARGKRAGITELSESGEWRVPPRLRSGQAGGEQEER
jgi:hypothetical protein